MTAVNANRTLNAVLQHNYISQNSQSSNRYNLNKNKRKCRLKMAKTSSQIPNRNWCVTSGHVHSLYHRLNIDLCCKTSHFNLKCHNTVYSCSNFTHRLCNTLNKKKKQRSLKNSSDLESLRRRTKRSIDQQVLHPTNARLKFIRRLQ